VFEDTPIDLGIDTTTDGDSRLADFSGDGLPDLWHFTNSGFAVRILRRLPEGSQVALAYEFEPTSRPVVFQGIAPNADVLSLSTGATEAGIQASDINGDGVADLVLYVQECTVIPPMLRGHGAALGAAYRVRRANAYGDDGVLRGNAVATSPLGEPVDPCDLPVNNKRYWITLDALGVVGDSYVFRGDSCLGPGASPLNCGNVQSNPLFGLSLQDINGDGQADVMFRRRGSNTSERTFHYRLNRGGANPGGRFLTEESISGLRLPDSIAGRAQLLDVNGDRRADLVYQTDCNFAGACSAPNPPAPNG